jgi:hypothetical protein
MSKAIEFIELTVKLQVQGKAENREFIVRQVEGAIRREGQENVLTDPADPEEPSVIALTVTDNKTGYFYGKPL